MFQLSCTSLVLDALAGKVALSLALVFLVVSASVGRHDEKETGCAIFGLSTTDCTAYISRTLLNGCRLLNII